MSQGFDFLDDERDVSSTDEDFLNPEDIDMEDVSHFSAHRNTSIHEDDPRPDDLNNRGAEDATSDPEIGGFDDEVLDEIEQDLEIYEYWEENNGVLDCQ